MPSSKLEGDLHTIKPSYQKVLGNSFNLNLKYGVF